MGILLLAAGSFVALLLAIMRAPEGHEDGTGFHADIRTGRQLHRAKAQPNRAFALRDASHSSILKPYYIPSSRRLLPPAKVRLVMLHEHVHEK